MENQVNMGNQNTQQIEQNPMSQSPVDPVPERSKTRYVTIGAAILVGLAVFGFGAYYLGKQSSKNAVKQSQNQTFPSPTITENGVAASWKTYNFIDNSITFKYPEDWQAEKEGIFGSRTVTEFKYNNTPLFELTVQGNYNQVTGKPYKNLAEFLGPRLNKSRDTLVDEQAAKRIDVQGDPGHVIPHEEVIVFTPDNKSIVSLYYESSSYDKPTANRVLDQILLTFKFLNKNTVATPTVSILKASLVSTAGWPMASATTFSILYPPEYNPFSSGDMVNLRHTQNPESVAVLGMSRVGDPQSAKPYSVYSGGSRREWWIRANYDDSHPQPANLHFIEKTMGEINGLEVYEGDYLRSILVAQNDKLYMVEGQTEIINVSLLETVVSTIKFK